MLRGILAAAAIGMLLAGTPFAHARVPNAKEPAPVAKSPKIKMNATPALWKIRGAHGTVYLFGSAHEMKHGVHWETPAIQKAFSDSHTAYFEIEQQSQASQRESWEHLFTYGVDDVHPLSTKISQEDIDMLDAAAIKLKIPGEDAFERARPWMAFMLLMITTEIHSGYRPEDDVAATLHKQAVAANKTVHGFETFGHAAHRLIDAPESEQVKILHSALVGRADTAEHMNRMIAYWTCGDAESFAAYENGGLERDTALYNKWLLKPHQEYTNKIAALLTGAKSGNVFVTLCAGDLAGPAGVIAMLEKRGFTVTRVE